MPGANEQVLRQGEGNRTLRPGPWFAWWCTCFLIWLALTTTFDPAETAAGVVASSIAATGAELVRATGLIGFRPRAAWFLRAPRVASRAVVDTVVVIRALLAHLFGLREMRGAFRTIRVDPGADDPTSAARRALLTAGVSATPNTYVVGIDRERRMMVVHQLVPAARDAVEDDVLGGL
jgi:multisubunit Na+/H+ antiporter MnhE subunit